MNMDDRVGMLQRLDVRDREISFAVDLLFFLAREAGIQWHPPGHPKYHTHPLSPFSALTETATRILIERCAEALQRSVDEIVSYECAFEQYITNVYITCFMKTEVGPTDLFNATVLVGRLGVLIQFQGVTNAIDIAIQVINQAITHYMGVHGKIGVWCHFNRVCENIIFPEGTPNPDIPDSFFLPRDSSSSADKTSTAGKSGFDKK